MKTGLTVLGSVFAVVLMVLLFPWIFIAVGVSSSKAVGWYCESTGRSAVFMPTGNQNGGPANQIECINPLHE